MEGHETLAVYGYELSKKFRSMPELNGVRLIAFTARARITAKRKRPGLTITSSRRLTDRSRQRCEGLDAGIAPASQNGYKWRL